MHKLKPGDRVRHCRLDRYGIYEGPSNHPDDAWVRFDGDPYGVEVSRELLAKVIE